MSSFNQVPTPHFLKKVFRPIDYHRWEWTAMRLLMAWPIATATAINAARFEQASQPQPVGIAQFVDLTWLAADGVRLWLVPLCWLVVALYATGFFPVATTLFLLLVHVGYGTLMNSQGAIHHTGQIIGLILLAQVIAHIVARHRRPHDPHAPYRLPIRYSTHAIAAAYVASAISKLLRSGGEWITNVPNIALQFEKNRQMAYYNYLERPESEPGLAMAQWVSEHPVMASGLFGIGLFLELFAFLALLGRWWALAIGLGLWGLHTMVSELMRLGFAYNKIALAVFFMNLPFWGFLLWERRQKRLARERVQDDEETDPETGTTAGPAS